MVNYFLKARSRDGYLQGQLSMYCDPEVLGSDALGADWTRVKNKILEDASWERYDKSCDDQICATAQRWIFQDESNQSILPEEEK